MYLFLLLALPQTYLLLVGTMHSVPQDEMY